MNKYKIKDICDLNLCTITPNDKYNNIIYLDTSSIWCNQISNLQKVSIHEAPSRAKRKVKNNTIVYSTVRPNLKHFGIISYPPNFFIVSTGFTTIDIKKEYESTIDARYVYYLLTNQSIVDYLSTMAESAVSAYPSINPDDIGELCFNFPNIDIQKKVASVIYHIDQKISLNTRINTELEAMAKQLYDYWFVQFDFPDENGKPYKSSGGKMVYNEKLKREIPEGWEVRNLFYIANYYNGLACQNFRPQSGEKSFPVIKISEMHNGFSSETERATINIPQEAIVENGDVLFAWSASLEVMLWGLGKGALNQHIFKVTSNNGFPKSFYYYQLLEYVGHFKKIAEAKKTTMGHITKDHLEQSLIVVPPTISIPLLLENILSPIMDKIVSLSSERIYLTNLRDSLLPMLMNGQVTVEE